MLDPGSGLQQVVVTVIAWIHGCMGLVIWLRIQNWWPRIAGIVYPLVVAIPLLALLGMVEAGKEVIELNKNPEFANAAMKTLVPSREVLQTLLAILRMGLWTAAAESGADAADIDPVGADDRETDQLALEEIRHMDDDIVEMLTGDFLMVGDQHVAGFETVAPMLRNRVLDDDAEIGNEVRHAAGVLRQQPAIGIDHRGAEIPDLAARRLRPVCASCPGSRG